MKLEEGIDLHLIESDKFTTNQIKIRFAAPYKKETITSRVLLANLLEIANSKYPTNLALRRQLVNLCGSHFSTNVLRIGQVHIVELQFSYISDKFLTQSTDLTNESLIFLRQVLFEPLVDRFGFEKKFFEIEKKNLIAYLESEIEDNAYHAEVASNELYYQTDDLRIPRIGTLEDAKNLTRESVYKSLQDMLQLDKIDIIFQGSVNQNQLVKKLKEFPFRYRNPKLEFLYQQEKSNIVKEQSERKIANQSIVELSYQVDIVYGDTDYIALLILNGLLGAYAHSRLFVNLREKEGLAYTINSQLDNFTGKLTIHAGIDKENKLRTIKGIRQEISELKKGNFTDLELSLVKKSLRHQVALSEDRPAQIMEEMYHKSVFKEKYVSKEAFFNGLNEVQREDIVAIFEKITLQSIYFLEGIE